jgi:hypothetical protein
MAWHRLGVFNKGRGIIFFSQPSSSATATTIAGRGSYLGYGF